MRAIRRFRAEPRIPSALEGLQRLATNLHWVWDQQLQAVFAGLGAAEWQSSHDPVRVVQSISVERWAQLAATPEVVAAVEAASSRLDEAIGGPRWFQARAASPLHLVAYFSPEFGISETLPQYSGGLGVLAGDHLKAASDLGVPLVAVGLLYAEGYFRQSLDRDGYQEERFPRLDPAGLALTPTEVEVTVDLAGDPVRARVWRADVGRVPLYLMDTAVEANSAEGRGVTDRLYGGDVEHRLRQEIVLGIGGVRALRELGLAPEVFHTNEGHAGFLALERIREYVTGGLSFAEAVEAVRGGGVFTTHTPVPAGIDRFPAELVYKYFGGFASSCGVTIDELRALGQRDDEPDDRFNMAVMGLHLAERSNGVAKLHGAVSRSMFAGMWPDVPIDEVPIGAITNGVHAHTWVAPAVQNLFATHVDPVWDGAGAEVWRKALDIPDRVVVQARSAGRRELVAMVRDRMGEGILDVDALTIGFARRFATYKRATLLLSQPERLKALLLHATRPVQFVFAGKAHPADQPGKEMIREIELFARQLDVRHRFVFVSDYDMAIARTMYHGCDVWLNNPRRPLEACGTSGMKAALNGGINCSILDGWWDECFDGTNGWAIASADEDPDLNRRDEREATHLFGLLEQDIVPCFYGIGDEGTAGWARVVKRSWASLGPAVTASRMVRDYVTEMYEPSAQRAAMLHADGCGSARALAAWKAHTRRAWPAVRFGVVDADASDVAAGATRSVSATVRLAGMSPADVAVEVLHAPIDSTGELDGRATNVVTLTPGTPDADGSVTYEGAYRVEQAGPYGCAVRMRPIHPLLSSPVSLDLMTWARE